MRDFRNIQGQEYHWLRIHWHKKADFLLLVSDTVQNLLHTCKHKNPHKIHFCHNHAEPLPNGVLNQIRILSDSPRNSKQSQGEGETFDLKDSVLILYYEADVPVCTCAETL